MLGLAAALGTFPTVSPAQTAETQPSSETHTLPAKRRSIALIYAPEDPELLSRLRGQTADLDWELIVIDAEEGARSTKEAARLGRARAAAAVIWFEPMDDGLDVHVVDVERGDELRRHASLRPAQDRLIASAAAEAAALMVRSILSSLTSAAHPKIEKRPPPVVIEHRPKPAPVSSKQTGVHVRLGWQAGFDSNELDVWQGPALGLALRLHRIRVGLFAGYALPRHLEDRLTRLRVSRYSLGLEAGVAFVDEAHVTLSGLVGGGVLAYERATRALDPQVTPTDARRSLAPSLAAELRLGFRPSGNVPLSIVTALSADVVAKAPILTYSEGGRSVERARIWPIQPGLGLFLQLESDLL